jgi:WD40 repeat protein
MRRAIQGEVQSPQGNPTVERWRISDCSKVATVPIPDLACGTAALAPDGRTLACDDIRGTLHIVEVASGLERLTKGKFALPMRREYFLKQPHLWAGDFEFSPDGRILIALPDDDGPAVVWDSNGRKVVKSQGEIKLLSAPGIAPPWAPLGFPITLAPVGAMDKLILRTNSFAFVSPDRLAIVRARWLSWKDGSKCSTAIVTFPAGQAVSSREIPHCPGGLTFGNGRIQRPFRRAADPGVFIVDYETAVSGGGVAGSVSDNRAMVLNFRNYNPERTAAVATLAVALKTGQIVQSHSAAFDVYGNHYVEEVRPGEVGLSEIGKGLQASVVVSKR